MHAQLVPIKGGSPITLTRDIVVVGRKRGLCDLVIDKTSISKLHSMLVKTDGLLFVRDLGSTNGTKVNGQRVVRGALLPGDQLSFASIHFKVQLGPDLKEEELSSDSHDMTEMIPILSEDDDLDDSSFSGFDLGASNSDVRLED